MKKQTHDRFHNLLFSVRRSVRYHDKREGFFLAVRNTVDFIIFLTGTAAALIIVQLLGANWPLLAKVIVPLAGAICTGIVLVLQVGNKAMLHNSLKRRFIALEQKMVACEGTAKAKQVKRLQLERLEIETEEPPIKRVLDTICHNELIHAMGSEHRDQIQDVSQLQRLFAHFFDYRRKTLYTAQ